MGVPYQDYTPIFPMVRDPATANGAMQSQKKPRVSGVASRRR